VFASFPDSYIICLFVILCYVIVVSFLLYVYVLVCLVFNAFC